MSLLKVSGFRFSMEDVGPYGEGEDKAGTYSVVYLKTGHTHVVHDNGLLAAWLDTKLKPEIVEFETDYEDDEEEIVPPEIVNSEIEDEDEYDEL